MTITPVSDPAADPAAVLADYTGWLHHYANRLRVWWDADHDDLVQEGQVAMWRALDTFDPDRGALPSWLTMKAATRMRDVAWRGHPWFGQPVEGRAEPTERGKAAREAIREYLKAHPEASGAQIAAAVNLSEATVSYHRKRLHTDTVLVAPDVLSLDALMEELPGGFDVAGADDVAWAVIEAYHEGEIAELLDVLTPAERRYVELRFWHGLGTKAMTEEFGYNPGALWRTARQRLAVVFSHPDRAET